ncbi:MAG: hypothetical protein PHF18_10745 [Methanosarcina sp.]|uniref:hypothetical protein n=1 Tax=Methanosarcina sp. TaxID=2213 RepID=UPI00261B7905|nr:hypothetical protein [Methanosarcina sp.]MDD3247305.1 hypothetical protein [Methanosarcina sp.]
MIKMDFRLIFTIGFASFVVIVIGLALIVTYSQEKKRSQSLVDQAKVLGFRPDTKNLVESLHLKETRIGNRQKIYNVFAGTFCGVPAITFDIDISIGNLGPAKGTSHGNTFKSSCIVFKQNAPVFLLQPKSLLSRNAYNDDFSLDGDASFLTDTLAQKIQKKYKIESTGTHVSFVPSGKRIQNINEALENAYSVFKQISPR